MTTNRRNRAAELAAGLAALTVLAALIAGLPAFLYLVAGSPLPHMLPSWHQAAAALTRRDDGTLFLAAVRYVAWIAWAGFTISVLIEVYCQARGLHAPQLRPAGGLQHLARALVTAVLVAFSSSTAAIPAAIPAIPTAAAPAVPGPSAPAVVLDAAVHAAQGPSGAAGPGTVSLSPPSSANTTVTVRPGDCLWTLAQHYLGNGDQYPQIAALNYGHDMGGGQRFTDAGFIRPGWVLRLPPAATTVITAPASGHQHAGHPSSDQHFAGPHHTAAPAPAAPPAYAARHRTPAAPPVTFTPESVASVSPATAAQPQHIPAAAVFAAGMVSGGLITTIGRLRHRQRQDRRPGRRIALPASQHAQRAERLMRTSTAPTDAAAVRSALAALAAGLRRSRQPLPPIAGLHLTETEVDILLSAPAPGPPAPFETAPATQNMCWRLPVAAAAAVDLTGAGTGDVLPGLVTAGTTVAGGHLLIDLEASGVVTADGPRSLVDRLMVTAATELATNPWSGSFDLIFEGFAGLAAASTRAQACGSLDEAITVLEERARQIPAGAAPRQNRLADPACPDWTLTLLIARTLPGPGQLARILDAATPGSGIAALLAGDPASADGREAPACLDLRDETGLNGQVTATLHPLGMIIRPRLVDESSYTALTEIFAATRRPDVTPSDPPYNTATGTGPPPPPAPARPGRSQPSGNQASGALSQNTAAGPVPPGAAAPLRISILGPLTITGNAADLQPKQAELVVALAISAPGGLSNEALRGMLGPDEDHPKPADQLRQIITRTRRKLGTTPPGSEYIVHVGNAQYTLDPAVWLDWHAFRSLAEAGRADHDPGYLRAALSLIRGRPFDGLYYWWISTALTETIRAEIVDVAELLANLELHAGDASAAARAARTGLAADNVAEQLWRALMRAEHAAGNTAGVHEAWRRCLEAIADIAADGEPHPATVALYRELTTTRTPAGLH